MTHVIEFGKKGIYRFTENDIILCPKCGKNRVYIGAHNINNDLTCGCCGHEWNIAKDRFNDWVVVYD